jgi:rubrerythrin
MSREYSLDEIFAIAEQIERNGAQFYTRAAQLARPPELAATLHQLAEWETGHESTFAGMRQRANSAAQRGDWDPEGEAESYLRALASDYVFKSNPSPAESLTGTESAAEIYRLALGLEKQAILFYEGMKAAISDDSDRALLDELIREEMSHVTYLTERMETPH